MNLYHSLILSITHYDIQSQKKKTKRQWIHYENQCLMSSKQLRMFLRRMSTNSEQEKQNLFQQTAEKIISAIKDEIKKLLESIKKQDTAFAAIKGLEQIKIKELTELKDIPTKINAEVGKIKIAVEEKTGLQRTIPPTGTD